MHSSLQLHTRHIGRKRKMVVVVVVVVMMMDFSSRSTWIIPVRSSVRRRSKRYVWRLLTSKYSMHGVAFETSPVMFLVTSRYATCQASRV